MSRYILLFFVSILFFKCDSARILGVFLIPSISHQVAYQPVWKELSLRGHKVTVISPNILNDPKLTNLTEIDVSIEYEFYLRQKPEKLLSKDRFLINVILSFYDFFTNMFEAELNSPEVQNLLNDKGKAFDLILVETIHPFVYGFAGCFKAPIVGISSGGVFLNVYDAVGNPTHPVITPEFIFGGETELSFLDRVHSSLYSVWYRILYHVYILPSIDKVARKRFGGDIPYLGDLERNISITMLNVNPILHTVRANVPAVIELSLLHITEKKQLPNDIQEYLDESTQGVIYFSLGSNVKSANLNVRLQNIITEALSELPYNVLWKWETDHLPGKPKNVKTMKWLPQQDVLGHPNIKAFVTQCGIQSMEEAISNGVPLVGMPFFGDQASNAQKMIHMGIGMKVDHVTMTKIELKEAILEVAKNVKYKENAKKIQNILKDQPMTGLQKAIWWIEYVIRHNGAPHLRSPAADMSWFTYLLMDVIVFVLLVVIIICYLLFKIVRVFWPTKKNLKLKTN